MINIYNINKVYGWAKGVMLFCLLTFMPLMTGAAKKNFTLVIDAGHGGKDTGAIGQAKVKEKDLTLKYALAFGQMVEQQCSDVKVVYTRKTDTFVELHRRAEIANRNKADLFISIHINALPKGRVAHGFQTYTLGTSKRTGKNTGVLENLEVAKRENAVIVMEKNYQQYYSAESYIMFEYIQDKNMENSVELAKCMQKYVCQATGRQDMGAQQDNLAVLRLTSMPGCLVECGFISTRDEESFMNSKAAVGMYARGLFNAFQAYRRHHSGNMTVTEPEPTPQPAPRPAPQPEPVVKPEPQVVPQPEVKPEPQVVPQPEVKPEPQVVPQPEVKPEPQPEVKPEPQSVVEPVVVEPVAPVVAPKPAGPVFKVQIFASSSLIKAGDARFKGLTGIDHYKDGGMYKYTVGESADYNEVNRLRREIADKFPQAFIVAFKDGVRMDVNQAINEFKKNKK